MTRINSSHKSSPVVTVCSPDHMNHGSDLMSQTGYDGASFFRAFRVSSAFLTKNSQMTSPMLDTRQAV